MYRVSRKNVCKAVEGSWATGSVLEALMRAVQTLMSIFSHNGYSLVVSNVENGRMFALQDNEQRSVIVTVDDTGNTSLLMLKYGGTDTS